MAVWVALKSFRTNFFDETKIVLGVKKIFLIDLPDKLIFIGEGIKN